MGFQFLEEVVSAAADAARPPERLDVAEASEKYIWINNPGSYTGKWKNSTAPYLEQVMKEFTRFDRQAVIFVAPAQSGKTSLSLNWMVYSIICDPMNFMIVEKTIKDASDFSRMRVDNIIMNCPEVKKRQGRSRHDDNVQDKKFNTGMTVMIRSPTVNTLSGKPLPRIAMSDYDRMPKNLADEGDPFSLAKGRITTFQHFGMVFAESSPSNPIMDPLWEPKTPHEAPPCEGIIGLYNQGNRHRWYWICVDCDNAFEPDFQLLKWPTGLSNLESGKQAWLECPHCGSKYMHEPQGGKPGKHGLNSKGFWLADGERYLKGGEIVGQAVDSSTASYWLKGVAAAFKSWERLVESWLGANEHFERTHSEDLLISTTNIDQGNPYLSKFLESERLPEQLRDKALDLGHKEIPEDVRFLVAAVDVQKSWFSVLITGVSEGGDLTIIDRYEVKYSLDIAEEQIDDDNIQYRWVKPGYEAKDWRLLLRKVLLKSYPIIDKSGRRMSIRAMIVDTGGIGGTTTNAYSFWRWLRRGPQNHDIDYDEWKDEWSPDLYTRLALYKGEAKTESRSRIIWPDSTKKDKGAGARGEIPVCSCNTNMLKDQLNGMLDTETEKTGRVRFPNWLPLKFYKELCVEIKLPDGKWENPKGYRNEAWDQMVMTLAVLIEQQYINVEKIDWDKPPEWAKPYNTNELVYWEKDETNPLIYPKKQKKKLSFAELAKKLG